MKRIRKSIELIRFNMGPILIYEILTKVLFYALMVPVLYASLNLSIELAGIDYLSKGTVKKYFTSPTTYLIFVLMMIIVSACILVHISGLLHAMRKSFLGVKTGPFRMIVYGIKKAFSILRPRNMAMVLYIIFILPFTCLSIISTNVIRLEIPGYIRVYLTGEKNKIIIFALLLLIISMVSVSYIYTLNYYVLRKKSLRESLKHSRNCLKLTGNSTIFVVIGLNVIFFLLEFLLGGLISRLLVNVLSGVIKYNVGKAIIESVIKTICTVIYLIVSIMALPVIFAYISAGFFEVENTGRYYMNQADTEDINYRKSIMKERAIVVFVILVAIVLDVTYFALSHNKIITINAEYVSSATVTAHRGASKTAPENTMPAFSAAIDQGADVIELDVHETRDGEIVVIHDSSLKRTMGVNKNVEDITYEELITYDAGILFGDKYKDTRVPRLEEVIQLVDGRCNLNIELKPADSNVDFVEKVVELVQKYDLYDDCVLTSPDYKVISKVKSLDEDITTIYVMSVAVGEFYKLEYADGFSIKYKYITNDVVKNVHKHGKEIYAWTIDDDELVEEVLLKGVDSIITNKPAEVKEYIDSFTDSIFEKLIKRYLDIGL